MKIILKKKIGPYNFKSRIGIVKGIYLGKWCMSNEKFISGPKWHLYLQIIESGIQASSSAHAQ